MTPVYEISILYVFPLLFYRSKWNIHHNCKIRFLTPSLNSGISSFFMEVGYFHQKEKTLIHIPFLYFAKETWRRTLLSRWVRSWRKSLLNELVKVPVNFENYYARHTRIIPNESSEFPWCNDIDIERATVHPIDILFFIREWGNWAQSRTPLIKYKISFFETNMILLLKNVTKNLNV